MRSKPKRHSVMRNDQRLSVYQRSGKRNLTAGLVLDDFGLPVSACAANLWAAVPKLDIRPEESGGLEENHGQAPVQFPYLFRQDSIRRAR